MFVLFNLAILVVIVVILLWCWQSDMDPDLQYHEGPPLAKFCQWIAGNKSVIVFMIIAYAIVFYHLIPSFVAGAPEPAMWTNTIEPALIKVLSRGE